MSDTDAVRPLLERIADALNRLSPLVAPAPAFNSEDAFVWHADAQSFEPVPEVNRVALSLLKGIDRTAGILLDNTRRFAAGLLPTTSFSGAPEAWENQVSSRPPMPMPSVQPAD